MAAYGLYTHIASNKFRSMLLLAGLFVLIYVMVYAGTLLAEVVIDSDRSVDDYLMAASRDLVTAFPYATAAAVVWIVIAYFFYQSIVDAVTGGEDVTRQQQPRPYNLLENLCISRGIPMPKLKIMQSDALNAFATGLNQRQYSITVTTGLLKALNDREIEAVLGHELTHIRNGDVQMMVIAVIIAGVVGVFGELPGATSAVMELCVDNPREGFADLFATHPSVDSRVQALVKFAGGHDPGRLALPSDRADGSEDRLPHPLPADQPLPRLRRGPWSGAGTSRGPWGPH